MSTPSPGYLQCDYSVVEGLIDVTTAALLGRFPKLDVDPYDVELVLDAMRVLKPKVAEFEMFTALLQMQSGHWDDAIHTLSLLLAAVPSFSYAKSLMALCLSRNGDPSWRQWADDALQHNPTPHVRQLVRTLAAHDDFRDAVAAHRAGQPFVTPASVALLREDDDAAPDLSAPPASSNADDAPIATQNYLRI